MDKIAVVVMKRFGQVIGVKPEYLDTYNEVANRQRGGGEQVLTGM